ncbi:MAG: hypothetical protein M3O50_03875 [Myxococcota bacterium]|nr:hypothetical protein [Myxococcota bacterium]
MRYVQLPCEQWEAIILIAMGYKARSGMTHDEWVQEASGPRDEALLLDVGIT